MADETVKDADGVWAVYSATEVLIALYPSELEALRALVKYEGIQDLVDLIEYGPVNL